MSTTSGKRATPQRKRLKRSHGYYVGWGFRCSYETKINDPREPMPCPHCGRNAEHWPDAEGRPPIGAKPVSKYTLRVLRERATLMAKLEKAGVVPSDEVEEIVPGVYKRKLPH